MASRLEVAAPHACSFAFARQRCDHRIERGAERRSAVLISHWPYTALLLPLASLLGPSLLSSFATVAPHLLSEATASWPRPRPGKLLRLSVGPQPVCGYLPPDEHLPQAAAPHQGSLLRGSTSGSCNSLSLHRSGSSLLASPSALSGGAGVSFSGGNPGANRGAPAAALYADVDVAEVFAGQVQLLWPLWEVCMLGRPLLVFARTPQESSAAVAALLSLLVPLPYQPDYRPLLSIHDPQVRDVLVCFRRCDLSHALRNSYTVPAAP